MNCFEFLQGWTFILQRTAEGSKFLGADDCGVALGYYNNCSLQGIQAPVAGSIGTASPDSVAVIFNRSMK